MSAALIALLGMRAPGNRRERQTRQRAGIHPALRRGRSIAPGKAADIIVVNGDPPANNR